MSQSIRAIYENGHLRLLDKVSLREGEHVWIKIDRHSEEIQSVPGNSTNSQKSETLEDSDSQK